MFTKPSFRPFVCCRFNANGFRPPKKKKKMKKKKMFSSFTLLLVDDVTWVMVRRYVVTSVIWQRVMTHLGLPHPAVVPFAQFHHLPAYQTSKA